MAERYSATWADTTGDTRTYIWIPVKGNWISIQEIIDDPQDKWKVPDDV